MKYWWLEKYKNFRIVQIKELQDDVNYFLIMPKNYEKQYQIMKDKDINELEEEELLIILKKIVNTKNIKNNSLRIIIEKLLLIPDNSFPSSDYTLQEMLIEIKNLKTNHPFQNKIDINNLAICYNCLNIFYVDKIKSVNRKDLCLCPYCLKPKLYFDNDYIPMNYTFIKFASIYYGVSSLGCTFKEIQKIVKKNIKISVGEKKVDSIDISQTFSNKKVKPIDEKIISKNVYDLLIEKDIEFEHEVTIYIEKINEDIEIKLLILLISFMEVLSNSVYIKKIKIVTNDIKIISEFKYLVKLLITN